MVKCEKYGLLRKYNQRIKIKNSQRIIPSLVRAITSFVEGKNITAELEGAEARSAGCPGYCLLPVP